MPNKATSHQAGEVKGVRGMHDARTHTYAHNAKNDVQTLSCGRVASGHARVRLFPYSLLLSLSPPSLPPAAGPCGRMPSRVVYVRFGLRRSCDGVCAVGVRAGAVGSLLRPSPLSPKSSTAVQRSDRGTGSVRVATRRRGRAEGERPPLRASGAALHEEGGVDSAFKRAWRHSLAD